MPERTLKDTPKEAKLHGRQCPSDASLSLVSQALLRRVPNAAAATFAHHPPRGKSVLSSFRKTAIEYQNPPPNSSRATDFTKVNNETLCWTLNRVQEFGRCQHFDWRIRKTLRVPSDNYICAPGLRSGNLKRILKIWMFRAKIRLDIFWIDRQKTYQRRNLLYE